MYFCVLLSSNNIGRGGRNEISRRKVTFIVYLSISSKECFCGDEDPNPDLILRNNDECSKQCGGDSNIMCGGGWRTSIYRTGLTGR